MSSFNKIIIVGYLGRDPVIRYTPQGTAVCDFSLATTERRGGGGGGDSQELTTWFKITVWGKQAEVANQYLAKGRQVYVEGRVRMEEYTDREGAKKTSLVVNASDLQFLTPRGSDESPAPSTARAGMASGPEPHAPTDDDIPF